MKLLITGGAGFIGSHLSDRFIAEGHQVTALDSGGTLKVKHLLANPKFRMVKGSVLDSDLVDSLVYQADLVYHLAAVVGVEHYVEDPYKVLTVNINGTQAVLRACWKYQRKVVFSSTSEIYGKSEQVPFREDGDRTLGNTHLDRWCYATSKAAAEHFCRAYGKMGMPYVIVRYFNVYGPRLDALDAGRVITIFFGQAMRGGPITLIGDGKQTRCFTYIDDAIEATYRAGFEPKAEGEAINIGSNTETTMRELAEIVKRASNRPIDIVNVTYQSVYGESYEDIPRRVPSVEKMAKILVVQAKTPLSVGIKRTWDYFQEPHPAKPATRVSV